MDVFREKGPALYFDLDTTIVDDLQPLMDVAKNERFVGLRNMNFPDQFASGVMSWNGDMSHIWEEFNSDPQLVMNQFNGDQDFIHEGCHHPEYFDDLIPNHIQSYKKSVRHNGIHPDCRVVAFHGRPKPWQLDELVKE